MIFSEIVLEAILHVNGGMKMTERDAFLKKLKHCRFKVGYYDEDGKTHLFRDQRACKVR